MKSDFLLKQLGETCERARISPFYHNKFTSLKPPISWDCFTSLPLTRKEELRAASPWDLLSVESDSVIQYHESFGTTGKPVSTWFTSRDLENYVSQINESAIDFHRGDRVLIRFPYAISVPAHIVHIAARQNGACVIPASSRTTISPPTRVIELMRKLDVTVLTCLPLETFILAETARQMDLDPSTDFPKLRAIGVAGELLTPAKQRYIEKIWSCKVYNWYGMTETGNLASTCAEGELHLSERHFYMEILDEHSMKEVGSGSVGTAVVTTLTRQAMPLIRYATADLVSTISSTCKCGRKDIRITHHGRTDNRVLIHNQLFSLRDMEECLFSEFAEVQVYFWSFQVNGHSIDANIEISQHGKPFQGPIETQMKGIPFRIMVGPKGKLSGMNKLTQVQDVGKPEYIHKDSKPMSPSKSLEYLINAYTEEVHSS